MLVMEMVGVFCEDDFHIKFMPIHGIVLLIQSMLDILNTSYPEPSTFHVFLQAYFFEDNDSDDQSSSDLSPLIRRPSVQTTPTPYTHIITGYLSVVELLVLVSDL